MNLAGPVRVLSDGGFKAKYGALFMTPAETRAEFERLGWSRVAAFQTRNPMHRSHEYLAKIAIEVCDGVLVHSLLGNLKPGDIPAEVRTRAIAVLIEKYFVAGTVVQAGYPLDMRYAGPREALLHARLPPELRLRATRSRPRPRRRRQLLRAVRRASHFRRDPARRRSRSSRSRSTGRSGATLRRHGFGAHLPARRQGPAAAFRARSCASGSPKAAAVPPEFSRPEVLEILREYYASCPTTRRSK